MNMLTNTLSVIIFIIILFCCYKLWPFRAHTSYYLDEKTLFPATMIKISTLSGYHIFMIRHGVKVSIGYFIKPGWKEPIEFYAFWCPVHGIVANHPHGHYQKLTCPKCFEDICDRPKALSIDGRYR